MTQELLVGKLLVGGLGVLSFATKTTRRISPEDRGSRQRRRSHPPGRRYLFTATLRSGSSRRPPFSTIPNPSLCLFHPEFCVTLKCELLKVWQTVLRCLLALPRSRYFLHARHAADILAEHLSTEVLGHSLLVESSKYEVVVGGVVVLVLVLVLVPVGDLLQ